MQSIEQAEIVVELMPDPPLADVIPMPDQGPASFYERNSAALPRLEDSAPDRYHRASLPTPIEPEPNTAMNRFKEFIQMNRPAWLPQR